MSRGGRGRTGRNEKKREARGLCWRGGNTDGIFFLRGREKKGGGS